MAEQTKVKEQKTELQKCREHHDSRLEDCNILLELERDLERHAPTIYDKLRGEYGELNEYGLSMDFADFGDEEDDKFFRYQFSWGGPQEEIRIYATGRMEFWYLDWGTGEHVDGEDFTDFIEYVTGLSIEQIRQKVEDFEATGEEPTLY